MNWNLTWENFEAIYEFTLCWVNLKDKLLTWGGHCLMKLRRFRIIEFYLLLELFGNFKFGTWDMNWEIWFPFVEFCSLEDYLKIGSFDLEHKLWTLVYLVQLYVLMRLFGELSFGIYIFARNLKCWSYTLHRTLKFEI